jgi:uncharacterized protein YukE
MANIIHMDTDSTRGFARQMAQSVEEMSDQIADMRGRVEAMNWISSGRDRFVSDYEQTHAMILKLLQDGTALSQRVSKEAEEWEAVAPWMGRTPAGASVVPSGSGEGTTAGVVGGVGGFLGSMVNQVKRDWNYFTNGDGRALYDPYELNEGLDYLKTDEAGKQLIEQAKQDHVKFVFPDNSSCGDPNGKVILVKFDSTGNSTAAGLTDMQKDPPEIVITNDWGVRHSESFGKDELAGVIGHEMQHALDYTEHLISPPELPQGDITFQEKYLSTWAQSRAQSEIRAYARESEIRKISSANHLKTIADIFNGGYEKLYEEGVNSVLKDYRVNFTVDPDGNVQAHLIAKVQPMQF